MYLKYLLVLRYFHVSIFICAVINSDYTRCRISGPFLFTKFETPGKYTLYPAFQLSSFPSGNVGGGIVQQEDTSNRSY